MQVWARSWTCNDKRGHGNHEKSAGVGIARNFAGWPLIVWPRSVQKFRPKFHLEVPEQGVVQGGFKVRASAGKVGSWWCKLGQGPWRVGQAWTRSGQGGCRAVQAWAGPAPRVARSRTCSRRRGQGPGPARAGAGRVQTLHLRRKMKSTRCIRVFMTWITHPHVSKLFGGVGRPRPRPVLPAQGRRP